MAKKPAANTSTKALLLVVVALAAVAFYLGQNPKLDGPGNADELIFPGFEPDAVTKISLRRGDQQLVFIKEESEKTSGDSEDEEERWRLAAPVEDAADASALRQILTQMTWIAPVRQVKGELVAGLKVEPPAAVLTLERPGEAPLVVKVGQALPDKTYGLVVSGREDLGFQIKPSFHDKLVRPLSELRRRELFTLGFRDLRSLTITARGLGQGLDGERRFVNKDGFWHIGSAEGPYADAPALESLAEAALMAGAVGVRDAESWTAEQIKAYALDPPAITIAAAAEDRAETLRIGAEVSGTDGLRAARFQDRPAVYTVNPRALLRALGQPQDRLRSRALLQIGGVPIERVVVRAGDAERALKLEGRDWILEGATGVKLDQEKTRRAVNALRAAQVTEHRDDATADGAPELVITVKAGPLERVVKVFAAEDGAAGRRCRRGERPGLLIAELPSLAELRDPDLKLRDLRFYEHDPFNLVELELLDARGERLRQLKKDGAELVEVGAEATTDPQRIQILTARLKALRAEEYVARLSPEALKKYGLESPERSLRLTLREWRDDKEELVKRTLLFSAAGEDGRRFLVFEGLDAIIRPVKVPLIQLLEEGFSRRGAGAKKDDEDG